MKWPGDPGGAEQTTRQKKTPAQVVRTPDTLHTPSPQPGSVGELTAAFLPSIFHRPRGARGRGGCGRAGLRRGEPGWARECGRLFVARPGTAGGGGGAHPGVSGGARGGHPGRPPGNVKAKAAGAAPEAEEEEAAAAEARLGSAEWCPAALGCLLLCLLPQHPLP